MISAPLQDLRIRIITGMRVLHGLIQLRIQHKIMHRNFWNAVKATGTRQEITDYLKQFSEFANTRKKSPVLKAFWKYSIIKR